MRRILIADADERVRTSIRTLIEAEGEWEVVAEAADGKEAVHKIETTLPDIVVLDYALPIFDALQVTRRVLTHFPKTEVLVLTTRDTEVLLREVLEAGARGFVLKSDAPQFLRTALMALAVHKPFFTPNISTVLLEAYLAKKVPHLSARQQLIVKLIAESRTNKEIGELLMISRKTVEAHRSAAIRKLGLDSTISLVRYAIRNKLTEA